MSSWGRHGETVDGDVDDEVESVKRKLSPDLFTEALRESPDLEIAKLVVAYKDRDNLALGNMVGDLVDEYLERVAYFNVTGKPKEG